MEPRDTNAAVQGSYNVEEAREYLGGISRSTLYKYMREDGLASFKQGRGRRMFKREHLDNFIESQEQLSGIAG